MTLEELRYPTGKWIKVPNLDAAGRAPLIEKIAAVPAELGAAVKGLTDAQLDTPYREGGWSTRQIVHHLADSHMNAFIRVKLGVTEDNPTIKPYAEALWAELPDSTLPVELSLRIIDAVHARWATILRSLGDREFARTYQHPERGSMTLDEALASYAWHGKHHTAHITELRKRERW